MERYRTTAGRLTQRLDFRIDLGRRRGKLQQDISDLPRVAKEDQVERGPWPLQGDVNLPCFADLGEQLRQRIEPGACRLGPVETGPALA